MIGKPDRLGIWRYWLERGFLGAREVSEPLIKMIYLITLMRSVIRGGLGECAALLVSCPPGLLYLHVLRAASSLIITYLQIITKKFYPRHFNIVQANTPWNIKKILTNTID
jgi:hypothetical protein